MDRFGYRTETFQGSGYRNVYDVLKFEIFELSNIDILCTILDNKLVPYHHEDFVLDLISDVNQDCYFEDTLQDEVIYQLVRIIKKHTGIAINYCLWLADKDAVLDNNLYGSGINNDSDVDVYETGDIILSDLGRDGKLFGYTEYPTIANKLN